MRSSEVNANQYRYCKKVSHYGSRQNCGVITFGSNRGGVSPGVHKSPSWIYIVVRSNHDIVTKIQDFR